MNTSNPTYSEAVKTYSEYLEHEQHASETTRVGYVSHLRRFGRYLAERHGHELELGEVLADDVRSYLYDLSRQGLRPRSLRGALYPVRGLFRLAMERGWVEQDPSRAVKLPKKDAAVRPTISDDELEQLLKGCEREPDAVRRAMIRAVLAVLVYAGLRRQELLDLETGDVDVREKSVLVRSGKGSKSRRLYVCQECVEAVKSWLAVRPPTRCPFLFLTDRRRRLGEEGLRRLMEDVKSLADLREHVNIKPHGIRHAAATRLLRNGADLRSIQQFLGHSQLTTTAAYLHTDEKQLQRIAELGSLGAEDAAHHLSVRRDQRDPPSRRQSAPEAARRVAGQRRFHRCEHSRGGSR
jgi:site-specific recombinase XerD